MQQNLIHQKIELLIPILELDVVRFFVLHTAAVILEYVGRLGEEMGVDLDAILPYFFESTVDFVDVEGDASDRVGKIVVGGEGDT